MTEWRAADWPSSPEDIPRGLGIYCGRVASVASASSTGRLITRLGRARARYVGLCVEATDGWRPTRAQLEPVVWRLVSAGVRVQVFALPGEKRARMGAQVALDALALIEGLPVSGIQLDAEEPYRGLAVELEAAMAALVDGADESLTVGVTTYGLPSEGGFYPWPSIVGLGYLVWQCYRRAGWQSRVRPGLAELRASWSHHSVLPAVAGYDRKSAPKGELTDGAARLTADLRRACLDEQGRCDVDGAWVWSEASLEGRELDALASWVDAVGWR